MHKWRPQSVLSYKIIILCSFYVSTMSLSNILYVRQTCSQWIWMLQNNEMDIIVHKAGTLFYLEKCSNIGFQQCKYDLPLSPNINNKWACSIHDRISLCKITESSHSSPVNALEWANSLFSTDTGLHVLCITLYCPHQIKMDMW